MQTVEEWLKDQPPVAFATVVETWGSAPRRVGAKMAVTEDMAMIGSVSGGCVETAVIQQAIEVLADQTPRLLQFGVSDEAAWEVGLTCGGKISLFVEPLDKTLWRVVANAVQNDQAATMLTILEGRHAGRKLFIDQAGEVQYSTLHADYREAIIAAAHQYNRSRRIEIAGLNVMVDTYRPRPHLITIGGVHIAQPLRAFARQLGFRVSLVDPRGVFASKERFPDVDAVLLGYPDKALPTLRLDSNTFIAVLTHDPRIDDKALLTALPTSAAHIGVLSGRKTHEARVERLQKAGLSPELIARIHTPIGVDIDAQTPEENALSIMAEIVAVHNAVPAVSEAAL